MLRIDENGNQYDDGQPNFSWVEQGSPAVIALPNSLKKKEWVESAPDVLKNPDATANEVAAYRTAKSVGGRKQPVVDDRFKAFGPANPDHPSYIMEPDLQESQGGREFPQGLMQRDDGSFYYLETPNETIPTVRRPGVLPIAATPEGFKFVVPKALDLFGNVMGNVGGPLKVAAKPGEMVLGSGMVRTAQEATKEAGPFYSSLERAVEGSKINLATPDQWLGYLRNQPGVKSEELNHVLGQLPKEGMLSKEQLADYVGKNKVELKEKVLKQSSDDIDWKKYLEEVYGTSEPTKYHSYQLPGGENYKETLLSLPDKMVHNGRFVVTDGTPTFNMAANTRSEAQEILNNMQKHSNKPLSIVEDKMPNTYDNFKAPHFDEHGTNLVAHIRHNDRNIEGKKALHLEEVQSDWHQAGRKHGYKGEKERLEPEFNKIEENLMATNDEKMLGLPKVEDVLKEAVEKKIITKNEADVYKRYTDIENGKPVPDAPFKRNWDELALKRMLHKAASEGYDALSWTPGEAQAARYDLSKQIERIKIEPHSTSNEHHIVRLEPVSGNKMNVQIDKSGKVVSSFPPSTTSQFEGKSLEDVVGKEIAEKIFDKIKNEKPYKPITKLPEEFSLIHDANGKKKGEEWGILPKGQSHAGSATGRYHKTEKEAIDEMLMQINHNEKIRHEDAERTLENIDLKIGGEGMKSFYDKMLVDKANALGKKYGSKVEQKEINTGKWDKNKIQYGWEKDGDYYFVTTSNGDRLPTRYNTRQEANAEMTRLMKENSTQKNMVHYLPISPELREKAKQGFPLFSSVPILSPVYFIPKFDNNKKHKLVPVEGNPFQ